MEKQKRSIKRGLPPGSIVHIGSAKSHTPTAHIINYDAKGAVELQGVAAAHLHTPQKRNTWISLDGIHDPHLLEIVGEKFDIHPLVLEDIANSETRPKIEEYDKYIFTVLKLVQYDHDLQKLKADHISLILGKNFVISVSEYPTYVIDEVRKRLLTKKSLLLHENVDFLFYTLLDALIDMHFEVLDQFSERIEVLEDNVMKNPQVETLNELHMAKREIIFLLKSVWPLRELVNQLERSQSTLLSKKTQLFIRDAQDHTTQIIDTTETYRDILSHLQEVYVSNVGNKLNEVMKVLTVISTIFLPLTFIAGLYGMNFKIMPELEWKYGYYLILAFMAVVAAYMVHHFKKMKWL
ncbi:MAG TPA: magnesium/cobalt transporter CorA [Acidobacteriota bacterium]|nr:magnesium/cobalt transporter CorA [Acidobacteriota bacterium]